MKRLGVAVGRTVLRAVTLERGRVVWAAERGLDELRDLEGALAALAAERPPGVRRARVALEADACQVKLLRGIPRLSRTRLQRALALQASRWFLRDGAALVTGGARSRRDGPVLAAAVDQAVLMAVRGGLAAAGLRLDGVSPAACLLAPLLPDGPHTRGDSPQEELLVRAGHLEGIRRRVGGGTETTFGLSIPGLEGRESAFAAAYAAACGPPLRLSVVADHEGRARGRVLALRLGILALLLWGTAVGVFLVRTTRAELAATTTLAGLVPALDAALAAKRDLALAEGALDIMDRAARTRSGDAALLEALTAALPDSAYLVAVTRSREDRVTVAGYAPSAARVLAALGSRPGVHEAALQGPVTREAMAGTARERFAIEFRWYPTEGQP